MTPGGSPQPPGLQLQGTGPSCAARALLFSQTEVILFGKSSASDFMAWFQMGNVNEKEVKLLRGSPSPPYLFPFVNEP